jgi:hypothetical protein
VRKRAFGTVCLLIALLAVGSLALPRGAAAASLPSEITESMTLTAEGGPYFGEPTIKSGVTVVVEPGAELLLTSLTVEGTLKAEGTAANPVRFGPEGSHWLGITFEPGSGGSLLDHTEVVKAGNSFGNAITLNDSATRITNSVIKESEYLGIWIAGGDDEIDHDTIVGDPRSSGIYYSGTAEHPGAIDIHDNLLEGDGDGIFLGAPETADAVSCGHNTVKGTAHEPIYYSGPIAPDITTNTVEENNGGDYIALNGPVETSATWEDPGVPIVITSKIEVAEGATLTMDPGVEVVGGEWIVKGKLRAEGEATDPVVFTAQGTRAWAGITFEPGSGGSVLEWTEVLGAGEPWGSPAILSNDASPKIAHTVIERSSHNGIEILHGGAPEISEDLISHVAGTGVYYDEPNGNSGEINIHGNIFEQDRHGLIVELSSGGSQIDAKTCAENTFREVAEPSLSYNGGAIAPDVGSNSFEADTGNVMSIGGRVEADADWENPGVPVTISELSVQAGATLTLQPGTVYQLGTLNVSGTLIAEGTSEEPIGFESAGQSPWGGIAFHSGSSDSSLQHVEVIHEGSEFEAAVRISEASPILNHSTFKVSKQAIAVSGGHPTIEWDRFRNAGTAISYEGEGTLDAPNDDWNCAGGGGPGPEGCGENVEGKIEWRPAAELGSPSEPCAGTTDNKFPDCLLNQYSPILKLGGQESYSPDSPLEMVENWGTKSGGLWSTTGSEPYGNELSDEGLTIGVSGPGRHISLSGSEERFPAFRLDASALGPSYPSGQFAIEDDWINEVNNEPVTEAHELDEHGFANRVYGRAFMNEGLVSLQYWYFYYYDSRGVENFGEHEGDWEAVQVNLNAQFEPSSVVMTEHTYVSTCGIEEMETSESGAPYIYVAEGSHAGYPKAGLWEAELPFAGNDRAYGDGQTIKPALIDVSTSRPSWEDWPGHWGNSRGGNPIFHELESISPEGPAQHPLWIEPKQFVEDHNNSCYSSYLGPPLEEPQAKRAAGLQEASTPVIVAASYEGRHPKIKVEAPTGSHGSWPRLILSVNPREDGLLPYTKVIDGVGKHNTITLPFKLDKSEPSTVLASLAYENGTYSPIVRASLPPASP